MFITALPPHSVISIQTEGQPRASAMLVRFSVLLIPATTITYMPLSLHTSPAFLGSCLHTRSRLAWLPCGKALAVRNAVLLGLTSSALLLVTEPVRAQTLPNNQTSAATIGGDGDAETTLPVVTVEAQSQGVAVPYAGGQVATGGRVGLLGDKDFMETPFSTISYTDEYIVNQHARDITDVISKTDPTVFSNGIPGNSQEGYLIRGFDSDAGDVTINGLAGIAAFHRSSPEMFERVEVLKGPSALLNGMAPRGSVGGSVNLVTKRAANEPLTRLTGSYSSRSHFGGHLDVGRRFGENKEFGLRFNGAYHDGETSVKTQDKKASLLSLGLDWRGTQARLSADLYRSKDHVDAMTRGLTIVPGLSLPTPPKPNVSWNPPWAFYDNTDHGAIVRGELDLNADWTTYASAGISKNAIDTLFGPGQIYNEAGDMRINFSGVGDRTLRKSADLGILGKVRTGAVAHQLAANATYYDENRDFYGYRNALPQDWLTNIYQPEWGPAMQRPDLPRLDNIHARLVSFGLADTLSFADERVQLTLGLRHQRVQSTSRNGTTRAIIDTPYDASAITPAAALLVKLDERVSIYGNSMEGLNQGAIAPLSTENAGQVFAPYKTKQKEVGIKFDLGEFAHTLSLYQIKRPSSNIDINTNVFSFGGEQRNRGVEWGFFGTPVHSLRLMGGLAYSEPKLVQTAGGLNQGKMATGVPKWQGKLGTEWDLPMLPNLTLTSNISAASKQYLNADNSMAASGRAVYDMGARYATHFSNRPLSLRFSVANLRNKAYWARANHGGSGLGAPRTFHLSVTMDV